jgi:glycosyltransferase involved in cell wall biosynthesis
MTVQRMVQGEYLDTLQDSRLTVFHQGQKGLRDVLNLGIDLCETPFLARMDADDISLPTRFQQQLSRLTTDPELVAVGSPLGFLIGEITQAGLPYPTEHEEIVRDLLKGKWSLSHATLIMRTSAARAVRYRIAGAGEDLDFCLRLAEQGKISNLASPHYLYRLHGASISLTKREDLQRGYAYAKVTALQRIQSLPEVPFSDFCRAWNRRNVFSRLAGFADSVSNQSHRSARISCAQKCWFRAAWQFFMANAFAPSRSVHALTRIGNLNKRRRAGLMTQDLLLDQAHGLMNPALNLITQKLLKVVIR